MFIFHIYSLFFLFYNYIFFENQKLNSKFKIKTLNTKNKSQSPLLEINPRNLQLLIPWDLGDYNSQTSKFLFLFIFSVFTMNFFPPKLMKLDGLLIWVFCTLIPNWFEHKWLKSQFHVWNYERVRILFVDPV